MSTIYTVYSLKTINETEIVEEFLDTRKLRILKNAAKDGAVGAGAKSAGEKLGITSDTGLGGLESVGRSVSSIMRDRQRAKKLGVETHPVMSKQNAQYLTKKLGNSVKQVATSAALDATVGGGVGTAGRIVYKMNKHRIDPAVSKARKIAQTKLRKLSGSR